MVRLFGITGPPKRFLSDWFFNKKNNFTTDGLEVVNVKGDNAGVKCSYCAHSSGSGEQVRVPKASIPALGLNDLTLEWWAKMPEPPAEFDNSIGCSYAGNDIRFNTYFDGSVLYFMFNGSGPLLDVVISTTNYPTDGEWHYYKVVCDRDSDMTLAIDGIVEATGDISASASVDAGPWVNDFRVGAYGNSSNGVLDVGTTQYAGVKLTYGDQVVLHLPLQGSCYDVSGNGRHATLNNSTWAVQDQYHYNLTKGFGLGVGGEFVPRLADDSGFPVAVTEEHLAGFNNMPESYFEFATSVGGDNIMDKSNVAIWSADIRASVHYDSENPNRWHSSELVQAYLDDNIAPAYKNRIFVADNNTTWLKDGGSWLVDGDDYLVELGDGATEAKHLLVYNTTQTGADLEKIVKFLAKQY